MRPRLALAADTSALRHTAHDAAGALPIRGGSLVQTPAHQVGVVSGGSFRRLYDSRMVAAYGYAGKPRLLVPDAVIAALPTAPLTAP